MVGGWQVRSQWLQIQDQEAPAFSIMALAAEMQIFPHDTPRIHEAEPSMPPSDPLVVQ